MNLGESSGGPSIYPAKRRRGRPRKDKHLGPAHVPPGFKAPKENPPHRAADNRPNGPDPMVGQTVTGVVESTFDAGYLLTVKIGNSNTSFRGLVFKPGHFVPVTAQNDVAPNLQMIRRNDVRIPENPILSRPEKLPIQTAPSQKRKYSSSKTPSSVVVPPVGFRGTVVPVVLQPVNNFPNDSPNPEKTQTQTENMIAFGDKDVHMVEPLSMLPPENRSVPVSQIFELNGNSSFSEGAFEAKQGEKVEPVKSTDTDNSSEEASDIQIENGKEEALKSSEEVSGFVSKQEIGNMNEPFSSESLQTTPITKPLFHYGTGRMTELLQAVQENMKENQVQIAEQTTSASKDEFHETRVMETDPENKPNVP